MKRYVFLKISVAALLLLILSACSSDIIDDVEYKGVPLKIGSVSIVPPVSDSATRIIENEDRSATCLMPGDKFFVWASNNPVIGVYEVTETGFEAILPVYFKYSLNDVYVWTYANQWSEETYDYDGEEWCENVFSYEEDDKCLFYVLQDVKMSVLQNDFLNIEFKHQLAKVRVILQGGDINDIKLVRFYCINGYSVDKGTVGFNKIATDSGNYISMLKLAVDDSTFWELSIAPQEIKAENAIKIVYNDGTEQMYTLSNAINLEAGKISTITLTLQSPE